MLNADRRLRVTLRLALMVVAVIIGFSASMVSAGVGPANRSGSNIPGQDFTVYRTVNTLSCHPQYPYPVEVPLYTIYAPTGLNGRGYCFSLHSQANPNFVGVQPGKPGLDGQGVRPAIPYRHYLVMEFPNPNAGAASGPNGHWVHWEGLVNIFELAVASGKEIWYAKDFRGGMIIDNRVEIRPGTFVDAGGQLQQGAYYSGGGGRWASCISWAGPPRRPGDEAMPCFDYNLEFLDDTPGIVWLNPNLFPTIPHNRYGQLTQPSATGWAQCLPEAVIANRPTSRVYDVPPAGCDYPALAGNPGLPPVEGYIGVASGPTPIPTPVLTATHTGTAAATGTTTPTPTVTTTPDPLWTPTPTVEPTATPTASATATITNTPTDTPTPTITSTPTVTRTPTFTTTPTQTRTPTTTLTATSTRTPTPGPLKDIVATASDNSSQASKLLDGLAYTRWETNWTYPLDASFTLDLGSARQVGVAKWQIGAVSMAQSFSVQVSNDGVTWDTVATRTAGPTSNAWQEQAINRQALYVRWLFSNPTNYGRLGSFSEAQLFAP